MWMLESDPGKRPSAKQSLMHSWFKNDQEIIQELLQVNDDVCNGSSNQLLLNFIGEMPYNFNNNNNRAAAAQGNASGINAL